MLGAMRRVLTLVCLLVVFPAGAASADDGSWSNNHELSEGPLYAVTENPAIALEKELLVLDDPLLGSVTAVFAFHNTSDQAVTVEAGFPVVLDLPLDLVYEKKGRLTSEKDGAPAYQLVEGKYGGDVPAALLGLAGLRTHYAEPDYEVDPELGGRFIRKADFPRQRVNRKLPAKPPFRFAITQDGQAVKVAQMVVELDPEQKTSEVVFHFRHRLVFAPGQTSTVRVTYQAPTLSAGPNSPFGHRTLEYTWRYVLRTGATWKGPLGQLVLVVPDKGECQHMDRYTLLGRWAGYRVLQRSAFEPDAGDDIVCTWKDPDAVNDWDDYWFGGDPADPNDQGHAEPGVWEAGPGDGAADVKDVKASSATTYKGDVYTDCCVIRGAPTTAAAAFDGIVETAWSEGDKTDVGQYLEFELTRPAAGLRIMGGFLGARHAPRGTGKAQKLLARLYTANSRPKRLELVSTDGKRRFELVLADKKGQWNVFPVLVPAGRYRLVILETYRGTRWQDTSIGEVELFTGDLAWLDKLRADPFFAAFFADRAGFLAPYIGEAFYL
jgi:hypothetical protein